MATLTTLRANTRTDLIIDPNGDIWSNATIDRFINEFVAHVYAWDNEEFEEVTGTFTLTTGVTTYDLSALLTNYGKLQSLRLEDRTNLLDEVPDLNDFEDNRDLTFQGEPSQYYFYGDQTVGLYPTPDGDITTINVRFNRSQPTLTDNDSPAWDVRWHFVAELYARWKCFSTVPGHEATAKTARELFVSEQAKMREDISKRDANGYRFIAFNQVQWPV